MRRTFAQELTRYMEASFPILYLNTYEEEVADQAILAAADSLQRTHIQEWNGFHIVDFRTKVSMCGFDDSMHGLLSTFLEDPTPNSILVLKEPAAQLEQSENLALVRELALRIVTGKLEECTVVIVSSSLSVPREIEHYIVVLETDPLDYDEIRSVVKQTADAWDAELDEDVLDEMSVAFKGLTESEIRNILSLAYQEYEGIFDRRALQMIFQQKQQTIRKSGILEMVTLGTGMEDIGGLENLKTWLTRKAYIFQNMQKAQAFGVDIPKGVLIAGLPGCGKSISAKATARLLNVPLLRLDIGRLMGKYVGESESNMRRAIALAEAVSPCVLWIDELEKAFAGIGGDGNGAEVTTRLLGTFLTWLQEKMSPAFVVATANDIMKLPPELLRKGRFDEIFFVSLPSAAEREKIFEIHLKKRRPGDVADIDLSRLAQETDGFSGADIEGVVRDSVEVAFSKGSDTVRTQDVLAAICETRPASKVMEDSIKRLKEEYKRRSFKNASAG